jgi:hypothetical protein
VYPDCGADNGITKLFNIHLSIPLA